MKKTSANRASIDWPRLNALFADIESLHRSSWEQTVRAMPIILKSSPESFIGRLSGKDFRVEQIKSEHPDAFTVRFVRQGEPKLVAESDFFFFKLVENIWLSICVLPSFIFKDFTAAVTRTGSAASVIYLSTRDFQGLFNEVAADGYGLNVLQHSAYNSTESSVRYLRAERSYRAVFEELISNASVIRSISASATDRVGDPIARFGISNSGTASLNRGPLKFFIENILLRIARIGIDRNRLLSGRARERKQFHPLTIRFDQDVLREKSGNRALIASLEQIEKMGIGVFHANPYLHLILTDFRDGSRFTLYSTSDRSLELVPSFRSSVSSIMRLHKAISEGFASCELMESVPEKYTLEDFVS